ncbi:MAG: transglycosylase SLT domain-containing protein [Deltaproteobacteria bacterium]|nr:transglycosylase SLT domain-containing protein [Deltaproteobacteria bacterium]
MLFTFFLLVSPLALNPGTSTTKIELTSVISALASSNPIHAVELGAALLQAPEEIVPQAHLRFLTARTKFDASEFDTALGLLDGLENDLPEIADVIYSLRAHILQKMGLPLKAIVWWRKVLNQNFKSRLTKNAQYNIAHVLFNNKQYDEAEIAYSDALKTAPHSAYEPLARFNLAQIAESSEKWSVAAKNYGYIANYHSQLPIASLAQIKLQALIKQGLVDPPNIKQQFKNVDMLLRSRQLDKAQSAIAHLRPLIASYDNEAFDNIVFYSAILDFRHNNFNDALAKLTSLVKNADQNNCRQYQYWLARTYSELGRYQDAVNLYLQIAKTETTQRKKRDALFIAGWLAYNGGDHRQAIELFKKFNKKYPHDKKTDAALWYLAWNAFRTGDLRLARNKLRQLCNDFPRSILVQQGRYWLGRFATLAGDIKASINSYNEAIKLSPLSYYGVLAIKKRNELETLVATLANTASNNANVITKDLIDYRSLNYWDKPISNLQPLTTNVVLDSDSILNQDEILDWSSEAGKRLSILMRLGVNDIASDTVLSVPTETSANNSAIALARAKIFHQLGDYNAAYRIIEIYFGEAMRNNPNEYKTSYFHFAYPFAHETIVAASALEQNISPFIILSVMRQESGYNSRARSVANANGLMQIIPPTAEKIASALNMENYHDDLLLDPTINVRFGAWYLAELLKKFSQNAVLAISSYNAGPIAVEQWVNNNHLRLIDEFVEEIPFLQTRNYVKRVISNLAVYSWLYQGETITLSQRVPKSYLANVRF